MTKRLHRVCQSVCTIVLHPLTRPRRQAATGARSRLDRVLARSLFLRVKSPRISHHGTEAHVSTPCPSLTATGALVNGDAKPAPSSSRRQRSASPAKDAEEPAAGPSRPKRARVSCVESLSRPAHASARPTTPTLMRLRVREQPPKTTLTSQRRLARKLSAPPKRARALLRRAARPRAAGPRRELRRSTHCRRGGSPSATSARTTRRPSRSTSARSSRGARAARTSSASAPR